MFPNETPVMCHPCDNHSPGIPTWEVGGTVVSPGPNLQTTLEGMKETIASRPRLQHKCPN